MKKLRSLCVDILCWLLLPVSILLMCFIGDKIEEDEDWYYDETGLS